MSYKYGNGSLDKYYNMVRMYNILESDTNDIGLTVHFDERNLDCFGIRIYHLLFMSCNLFEVAAKEIAGSSNSNMGGWKEVPEIRQFSDSEMTFLPMGYKFKPLETLGEVDVNNRKPTWWQGYNDVKHDLTQIHNATLRNLIYALSSAGLLVNHVVSEVVRSSFDGLGLQKPQIDGFSDSCLDRSVLFDGLKMLSIEDYMNLYRSVAKRSADTGTVE